MTEWQEKLFDLEDHLTVEQIAAALACSTRQVAYLKAGKTKAPRTPIGDALRALHVKHCNSFHGAKA